MYLNTEKGNTNIDNQFNGKKEIDFSKLKLPLIVGGITLVIIIGVAIFLFLRNKVRYFITLEGDSNIKMYQGDTYVELGYSGFDNKKNDLTNNVIVNSQVDTSVVGTYEITYELGKTVKKRTITIVEKGIGNTFIHLTGKDPITLSVGSTYQEPGYKAIDSIDSDITSKVEVSNNVDTSKPGIYKVTYTVTNSSGVSTSKIRTVIVK